MSKIALQGDASGTGTFTIASPNSNTDRTLTLPDEAGTVLTSASSIPVANLDSAVGITQADIWRLTTTVTGTVDLTSLEQPDDSGVGVLGSSMTESSGVFTFPSTGIWLVLIQAFILVGSSDSSAQVIVDLSTDGGSNFDPITTAEGGSVDADRTTTYAQAMVDVTNTANFKIKFRTSSLGAGSEIVGRTDENRTSFAFIRLGDT